MKLGVVYRVTNTVDGLIYVGQTTRTAAYRWSVHKSEATRRPRSYFHKAIAKYGHEVFFVDVLGEAEIGEPLDRLEQHWIMALKSSVRGIGYNLTAGGDRGMRTAEACRNNALARIGKPLSDACRAKMSAVRLGRPQTEAHRLARALAQKGRIPSEATRRAVAESNRRRTRKVAA